MKKVFGYILVILLIAGKNYAQTVPVHFFHIGNLPEDGVLLNKGWKFHPGDSPDFVKPGYDDSKWESIDPTLDLNSLPQTRKEAVGWFRITLQIDSSLLNKPLAFQVYQTVASEIFLDGKMLQHYGVVSQDKNKIKAYQPLSEPNSLVFTKPEQVLAVRFSVQDLPYFKSANSYSVFSLIINDVEGAGRSGRLGNMYPVLNSLYTGLFMVLTIIHLGLYIIFRKQKANLFFSIATLSGAISNALWIKILFSEKIAFRSYAIIVDWIFLLTLYNLFLFIAVHYLFKTRRNTVFWLIVVYSITSVFLWGSNTYSEIWAFMLPFWTNMAGALIIAWQAYRTKRKDAVIIVAGISSYLILYTIFVLLYHGVVPDIEIGIGKITLRDAVYQVSAISVPFSLSFYLARDFALTSRELEKKLIEVQKLSGEKQQILQSQNLILEEQVHERTSELSKSLDSLKATQAQLIQSEKMASLGELTAGIAHEIQNPLNFVNNFSDVNTELIDEATNAINSGRTEEAKELLSSLKENEEKVKYHGQRADAIVKSMLQHSRTSTGIKEPTEINALTDEYLRLAYHGLRAKDKSFNATLQMDFDQDVGKVSVISQDIGRVLLNLFNNAFYAVAEKKKVDSNGYDPTVMVSTRRLGNKVEIRVRDNGPGIPEKVREKIFQPFFTTKPTGHGTGLGLSLSYEILKAHGGELKAESDAGAGAMFIMEIPVI